MNYKSYEEITNLLLILRINGEFFLTEEEYKTLEDEVMKEIKQKFNIIYFSIENDTICLQK